MKKTIFYLAIFFALVTTSCNDECQTLLDDIQVAKTTYENAPNNANCLNYKSLLEKHLSGSCGSETEGINYDVLFQNYLDSLQCSSLPTVTPTCTDGIQNGAETGVDCGGACAPCSTFFMSCQIDGSPWDAFMQGNFSAALDTNGFIKGYIDVSGQGEIKISNSDDLQQTGVYSFTENNLGAGEAMFLYVKFDSNTSSFKQYKALGTNGTLEVTDINTANATISGTFSLQAYQNNVMPSDTVMITGGGFFLPISN